MNALLLLLAWLAVVVPGGRSPLMRADEALEDWDRGTLTSLVTGGGEGAVFARTALAVLEGRFDEAQALEAEAEGLPEQEALRVRALASQAANFSHLLERLERQEAEGLLVFAPKGQARVLAPLAQELLEAHRATGLPGAAAGQLRLVFAAQPEDLAALAGLEPAQVKAAGLLGLGRWGTVVLLSPAAVPSGYDWQRVLAHELLHLGLHGRCGDAPLWFEEGTAHLLDRYWRDGKAWDLEEGERGLLALAQKRKKLRTWEELGRSFAAVSEPWEAAMAFAQAGAAVGLLLERSGVQAPEAVCSLARRGVQFEAALARVWGGSALWFRRVSEARWQKKPLRAETRLARQRFGLDRPEQDFAATQLGDMLWGRGHENAALTAFRASAGEEPSAELAYRMALLLARGGQAAQAQAMLERALQVWGPHGGLFLALALALETQEKPEAARAMAERAFRMQPFSAMIGRVRARLAKGQTP